MMECPRLLAVDGLPTGEDPTMKFSRMCLLVLILTELLTAASPAQEKKISRADLPAAVEKTVVS